MSMIEYPSSLCTSPSSSPSHQTADSKHALNLSKPSNRDLKVLRRKIWDAQRLAQVILGRDAIELDNRDILDSIRSFALMKQELKVLRRQSTLMKRMMAAVRGSQSSAAPATATTEQQVEIKDDADAEEKTESTPDAEKKIEDKSSEEATTLENQPVKATMSQSLAVGVIADLELKLVEWKKTFEKLNQEHEESILECQGQLEKVCVRLDDASTKVDPSQANQARDRLEKLMEVISAFPSKARIQELEDELRDCRAEEQKAKLELAKALEELEARNQQDIRQREERQPRTVNSRERSSRFFRKGTKKISKLFRKRSKSSEIQVGFSQPYLSASKAIKKDKKQADSNTGEEPLMLFDSSERSSEGAIYGSPVSDDDSMEEGNRKEILGACRYPNFSSPENPLSDVDSKDTKPDSMSVSISSSSDMEEMQAKRLLSSMEAKAVNESKGGLMHKARGMLRIK